MVPDQKAVASCGDAIRLKPNFAEAYYNRGLAFKMLRQYAKAVASCNDAIRLKANFAEAHCVRGSAYSALKRYPKALADYNVALGLNAQSADVYYARGQTYLALKQYSKAVADFTAAIGLRPDFTDAYNVVSAIRNREEFALWKRKTVELDGFLLRTSSLIPKSNANPWRKVWERLTKEDEPIQSHAPETALRFSKAHRVIL